MNPRIITGSAKGVVLEVCPGVTKPITDQLKSSMFSMLADDILDKNIVDLYAGTGSLGLEALSRGARACVFVENNSDVVEILKQNIEKTKLEEKSQISKMGVSTFIDLQQDEQYDIVFAGPPFPYFKRKKPIQKFLAKAIRIIPSGGGIVLQHPPKQNLDNFENLKLADTRCFGNSCFSIWVKMSKETSQ
jgi:16S rRNA (guanine(966)-N(2))-methyltransferase RsmD